jgi:hypothetical protein
MPSRNSFAPSKTSFALNQGASTLSRIAATPRPIFWTTLAEMIAFLGPFSIAVRVNISLWHPLSYATSLRSLMSAVRLTYPSGVYGAGGFAARDAPLVAGLVFGAGDGEVEEAEKSVLMLSVLNMSLAFPEDVMNELVDAFNECAVIPYVLVEGPTLMYVLVYIMYLLLVCR